MAIGSLRVMLITGIMCVRGCGSKGESTTTSHSMVHGEFTWAVESVVEEQGLVHGMVQRSKRIIY